MKHPFIMLCIRLLLLTVLQKNAPKHFVPFLYLKERLVANKMKEDAFIYPVTFRSLLKKNRHMMVIYLIILILNLGVRKKKKEYFDAEELKHINPSLSAFFIISSSILLFLISDLLISKYSGFKGISYEMYFLFSLLFNIILFFSTMKFLSSLFTVFNIWVKKSIRHQGNTSKEIAVTFRNIICVLCIFIVQEFFLFYFLKMLHLSAFIAIVIFAFYNILLPVGLEKLKLRK